MQYDCTRGLPLVSCACLPQASLSYLVLWHFQTPRSCRSGSPKARWSEAALPSSPRTAREGCNDVVCTYTLHHSCCLLAVTYIQEIYIFLTTYSFVQRWGFSDSSGWKTGLSLPMSLYSDLLQAEDEASVNSCSDLNLLFTCMLESDPPLFLMSAPVEKPLLHTHMYKHVCRMHTVLVSSPVLWSFLVYTYLPTYLPTYIHTYIYFTSYIHTYIYYT